MQIRIEIQSDEIDASEFFDCAEDAQDWLIDHTDLEPSGDVDDFAGRITFYHIGGYELLRDGTQEETVNSLEELQEFLDEREMEYDKDITDIYKLANTIEDAWEERNDDGGGSGWIE